MNDRFKFRIWNKQKEIMQYFVDFFKESRKQEEEFYMQIGGSGFTCFGIYGVVNNPILMQSTELKDKNGKLIYEGDILKCKENITWKIQYGIETEFDKELGFWQCAVLSIEDIIDGVGNFAYPFIFQKDADEYEFDIVGNIYQNEELLKN